MPDMNPISLPERLAECLLASEPAQKVALTQALWAEWQQGPLNVGENQARAGIATPGRPSKPLLVSPMQVPRRRLGLAIDAGGLSQAQRRH